MVQGGLKAGRISKPYGLQGDVHILLNPSVVQKLIPGTPLFIDLDGQRVPFFIESAELVGAGQAIVKVEFIDSLEEARKVIACDVYLDQKLTQEADSTGGVPGQMIAYRAVDRRLGEIGVISEHIPNEMNPVWVIKNAGKEIIIPATEDFIQSVDHINKVLHLDLPEGITDL